MPVPINFRKSGEGILATYDFVDIASGTGYITFYAGRLSGANLLSNVAYYADPNETMATAGAGAIIDIDFDTLVNHPLTLKGTAIINISFAVKVIDSNWTDGYVTAKLRKWDGTTETEIASATSTTTRKTGGGMTFVIAGLSLTVPKTHFKKDEYIRLTILGYASVDTATGQLWLYHDPQNRISGAELTRITKALIPVRIDL